MLLKLNSFIFYLRIFEKQCNAPFVDLLWLNYLNITLLGERGVTFDVVNVVDPETWVFRRFEYSHISHICRHKYSAVLCYWHGCCEFVHRFILFVFSEFVFVLYRYTLSIWMNEYLIIFIKKNKKCWKIKKILVIMECDLIQHNGVRHVASGNKQFCWGDKTDRMSDWQTDIDQLPFHFSPLHGQSTQISQHSIPWPCLLHHHSPPSTLVLSLSPPITTTLLQPLSHSHLSPSSPAVVHILPPTTSSIPVLQ